MNEQKPLPNFHACRVRDPGDFRPGSFRTLNQEAEGKPINLVVGRLKGETTTTLQSFRYPKGDWTPSEAKRHCSDHDGQLFEPAAEEELFKMKSAEIALWERQIREADLQALVDYEHGMADAPVLYKAEGYVQADNDGPMVFVASDEAEDRLGDTIEAGGWDLRNFRQNPVLMYIHDYSVAPIGSVPKVWVAGKQLLNTVIWDEADDLACFIKGKYERKFMRAVSVGFRALEYKRKENNGILFTKQELLEISAVPIPAHPYALMRAMGNRPFRIIVPEMAKVGVIEGDRENKVGDYVDVGPVDKGGPIDGNGLVLNKPNREHLQKAMGLLQGIWDSLETTQETVTNENEGMNEDGEIIREEGITREDLDRISLAIKSLATVNQKEESK